MNCLAHIRHLGLWLLLQHTAIQRAETLFPQGSAITDDEQTAKPGDLLRLAMHSHSFIHSRIICYIQKSIRPVHVGK